MKPRLKPSSNRKQRKVIGRIVSSVVHHKQVNQKFCERLNRATEAAFKKYPFNYSKNLVPAEASRAVARFLEGHYMNEVGLSRAHQALLRKLMAMAERREIYLDKKKGIPNEVVEKMDSLDLKGDFDKLYKLFCEVLNRGRNHRVEYTHWLYANFKSPILHADEKVHIVQKATRYIGESLVTPLNVLWEYKKFKEKK